MRKILFICTGNTCRSPMAEAILKYRAPNQYEVKSAGVYAAEGDTASKNSIEVLRKQGIPIEHKSMQLDDKLVNWSDLMLTMTNAHKQVVGQYFPQALDKIFSLKEFAEDSHTDITDPFGGSLEDYEAIYNEIDEAIQVLLKKLENPFF